VLSLAAARLSEVSVVCGSKTKRESSLNCEGRGSEWNCRQPERFPHFAEVGAFSTESARLGYASLLFRSAEAFANHDNATGRFGLLDINLRDVSGIE